MIRSQRIKIYDWCRANLSNPGAKYPKVVRLTHYEYQSMSSNLRKHIPYAACEIVVNEGNYKYIQFYIR